jgi:hypothetical protein
MKNMNKVLSMLNISTLLIFLMGIGGCTDDAVKKSETAELTKDEYLDSLVKNNSSYSPLLMIDSTIVTGSMGFRFADTVIFGVSDLARTKDPFVLCRIGAIEPLSPDYDKVAVYTKVERFISFRAADSASQFGARTGDTTLIIGTHQYQRVSHALPPMTAGEQLDFIRYFPHKNTREKEVCDSFIKQHRPITGNWIGSYVYYRGLSTTYESFYNDPTDIAGNTYYFNQDFDPYNYIYVFKSGKATDEDWFDKDICRTELEQDWLSFMSITNEKLADGREHQIMFVKIPYTYWSDRPNVSGFVRFKYVLN